MSNRCRDAHLPRLEEVNIAKKGVRNVGARFVRVPRWGLWSAGDRQFPDSFSEDIDDAEQFG
jgi:hypothetical protein